MWVSREAAKPRRETVNTHPDFAFFAPSRASVRHGLSGDNSSSGRGFQQNPKKGPYRAGTAAIPFSTRRAISCLTLRIFSIWSRSARFGPAFPTISSLGTPFAFMTRR